MRKVLSAIWQFCSYLFVPQWGNIVMPNLTRISMKRSLNDITPVATSHNAGMKRVLLSAQESGCGITQIAITDLNAGEIAEAHAHSDMQEGFYVLSGELDMVLDGVTEHCQAEDFVYVKCGTRHELRAVTDVRVMTIGCEI